MRIRFGEETDHPLFLLALVAAVVLLGQGLNVLNGSFSTIAFRWAGVAFAVALLPIVLPAWRPRAIVAERMMLIAIGVALFFEFWSFLTTQPTYFGDPRSGRTDGEFEALAWIAAGLSFFMVLWKRPRAVFPLVLATFALLGVWAIKASPAPAIDVFSINQDSIAALLRGDNPYTITFANPYPGGGFYPPGTSTVDRLLFGYVYPPWTLFVALPGFLLLHDYRYSFVAALLVASLLTVSTRTSRWAPAAIALFLFTPRVLFMIEQGWTEPVVIIGVALTVYAASRRSPWLIAVGLGILACSKQYTILAVPAVFLLKPIFPTWTSFVRTLAAAVAIAALLTLPMVLWAPREYWHWVYGMQFSQPYRPDALSLSVFWVKKFDGMMPQLVQVALFLGLGGLALLRAPRTPSGFAWAVGTLYFIFFMCRVGFCNHYFLVIATYAIAVAAAAFQPPAPAARAAAAAA